MNFLPTVTGFLGPFLIHRLACRIRGAEGDDSDRRSPPRPGPRSVQPSESSSSGRLGVGRSPRRGGGRGRTRRGRGSPGPRHQCATPYGADPTINSLLKHQRRGQLEREVISRRRRRRGHARAPAPAAYRLSAAAMTPRERERNRLGCSRRRRHRGRRRLRLPRDVSSSAHSPSPLGARQAGGRAGASTPNSFRLARRRWEELRCAIVGRRKSAIGSESGRRASARTRAGGSAHAACAKASGL